MKSVIPTRLITSVAPDPRPPRQIAREFHNLLDAGMELRPCGEAKEDPVGMLLSGGYTPKYRIDLFDTRFYLTNALQNPALRFLVGYVVQGHSPRPRGPIYPRIFYKDISLVWRAASHLLSSDDDFWIGKGDVRELGELVESDESTSNLPLEIQAALETLNRKLVRVRSDVDALYLVLQKGAPGRIEPFADFTAPRRRAGSNAANLIHGGQRIAWFGKESDPGSLKFAPGFQPDFDRGLIDQSSSTSAMYGGPLQRFRILSKNGKIQYMFFDGARHAWIIPPQTLTTELSSFGVRTIDVLADEDLFVPGYEYHYFAEDADPEEHFSQIPAGFAGEPCPHDPDRADASAWLDALPVIREFRTKILRRS
jgi:hypothetical protein